MADSFGLKIGIEGEKEFKNALREINQSFRVLGSEMKLVTSEFSKNDKSIQAITARNAQLNKEIDAQKDKVSTLEKALANAASSFGENDRRTLAWQIQLNNANAELNTMERELKESQEEVKKLNREKVDNLVKGLKDAGDIAGKVLVAGLKAAAAAMAAIGAGAVATGKWVKDSLNLYADYEDAMKQVQATMGLAGEEGEEAFKKLSEAAKEAGASTRFTASESAEALNYLALAGYDAEKAIEALPGVLTLAAAGGMDLARASDLVTDSMAALGLETSQMGEYMDKMARTSQKSNTNVQQLGEGILVAGATMKNAGQELDTLNVMLGVLANRGIKGSEGGTKLRNIIMSLASPTAAAAKELDRLGISITDSSGNIKEMNEIFEDLNEKLGGLSEADKMNALSNIFNKQDLAGVNALLSGTGEEMNNLYKELANAEGAALQMSETMESGLAGSVRSLKSAYEGLQIVIGEQFSGLAQDAVNETTTLVRDVTKILNDGFQEGDIEAIGEKISSFLMKGIKRMSEFLPEVISMVSTMLTELVNVLVALFPTLLPPLLDGAMNLLKGLIDAVISNVTPLVEMVVYLVKTVADFIIENLPLLIEAAIGIVVALALGIADSLPELIPAIVLAVVLIAETLLGNMDKIIDAAFKIILGLAEGLMDALPKLIEALPKIINSIIDFITGNLPLIVELGIKILIELIAGLIKAIPQLIMAIPQIVAALIVGLGKAAIAVVEVGKNIVLGLWDGISSMVSWIKDKVSDFVGGIVSGIKGLLGIKSPSAVFSEMGVNMALGIGEGFKTNMNEVEKGMENSIPTDFEDTWKELSDNAIKAWSKINVSAKEIWTKLETFFKETWKKTSENFNVIWRGINDFSQKHWSGIRANANTVWTALSDFFNKNFTSTKASFETVWKDINRLAEVIWQEIRTQAISIWNAISDFYNTSWRNTKASFEAIWYGIRDTFISIWIGLKTSAITLFNDVVNNIKNAFNIDWWSVGRSVIDGITRGVMDTARSLARAAADAARAALDAAKSALGISSPSKVFRDEVGLQIGAGFAEGIDKSRERLMESMQGLMNEIKAEAKVNITGLDMDLKDSSLGVNPGVRGITQNITIVSPKPLSERELAREFQNTSKKLAMGVV